MRSEGLFDDCDEQTVRDANDFIERTLSAADAFIPKHTVPIGFIKDGQFIHDRSGVLLQIDRFHFLITAGHDILKAVENQFHLTILMPPATPGLVPIVSDRILCTKNPKEDLCVTLLDDEASAKLKVGYCFLRLTGLISSHDPSHQRAGLYVLGGFPRALMSKDEYGIVRCGLWTYLVGRYAGNRDDVEDFAPTLHFIVNYERSPKSRKLGKTVEAHCMSGGGMWRVPDSIAQPGAWDKDFKLAAIETAWHKKHEYAKGTWINIALVIIWKYFPDCRSPMRLHGIEF